MVIERIRPITQSTRVRVLSGTSMEGASVDNPSESITYNLTANALAIVEGGAAVRMQAWGSGVKLVGQRVPFVVAAPGVGGSIRGTDYDLVDSAGDLLPGDYFFVSAGQIRGDIYVKPLTNAASTDDSSFTLEMVRSNGDGSLGADGAIGVTNEAAVTVTDSTTTPTPLVAFAESLQVVTEPGALGALAVTVEVVLDRIATGPVSVTIGQIAGDAVAGTDYTLVSSVVSFVVSEDRNPFTINVLPIVGFHGQRTVRFRILEATGANLVDGGSEFHLTINDDEVDANWDVIWDPLHNETFALQEGSSASAKLVFAEGVPNSEDVLVGWRFRAIGGSGLVLGLDVTTSAVNPITIPAGLNFVEIPLTAPADSVVDIDKSFELEITSTAGGGAEIGNSIILEGTLYDTTIAPPTVSWVFDELSVIEGGQGWGQLILSEAQLNPVTVTVHRSGTAGPTDLVYQGERDPLVFPIGETVISVWFAALQDTEVDPSETAVFTIQVGTGYTVGIIPTHTVSITEPASGSSTVEFRPMNGVNTLVSTCTGFDPHPTTAPPQRKMGGVKCDVFPIDDGRRGQNPVGWECVAYVGGGTGQLALESDDGTASFGPGFTTVDISMLEFRLQTVTEGSTIGDFPHTVTMADAFLVETTKEGHYVQDQTWLLRPKHPTATGMHEYCGQIMLWVTRRPDCVKIRAELLNEAYDPTRPEGHEGSEGIRDELDGTILFSSLQCDTFLVSPRVAVDPDSLPTCAASTPISVSDNYQGDDGFGGTTSGSPPHILPPQRVYCWDFVVYEQSALTAVQADEVLRDYGHGAVVDGPDAYYLRPWYSPNAAWLPEPTSGYTHSDGGTGFEASRQYGVEHLSKVAHVLNGTADIGASNLGGMWYRPDVLGGNGNSWFSPSTYPYSYTSGGAGIMLQRGFDMHYNSQRAMWLESRHKVQAECSGIMDITTGFPLTGSVAQATNFPGNVGFTPMYASPNNKHHGMEWQWFNPLAAASADVSQKKRPGDRAWSQLPAYSPTTDPKTLFSEPLSVQTKCGNVVDPMDPTTPPGVDLYDFGTCDIDHHPRIHSVMIAVAWQRNSSWAKFWLRKLAARIERIYSYVPVRAVGSAGETFSIRNQDLTQINTALSQAKGGANVPSDDSIGHGGFITRNVWTQGGTYVISRTRGEGHLCNVQAAAGAVTPPGAPDYADRNNWWTLWLNASKLASTDFGSCDRESQYDRQGVILSGVPRSDNWPAHGAWDPTSYIPTTATSAQYWKTAWAACRHFSGNKVYGDTASYAANIRQFCDTQALAMFRVAPAGARVSGRSRPMKHIVTTSGLYGQEDIPGSLPVSHDVRWVDGSPALSDTSICQQMVESLRGLDEMGEATLFNELLGYVKEFFGLTAGHSLGALIAELHGEMNRSMGPNERWAAGYVCDLLGFLQHKNR